jgi:hypothetical protein
MISSKIVKNASISCIDWSKLGRPTVIDVWTLALRLKKLLHIFQDHNNDASGQAVGFVTSLGNGATHAWFSSLCLLTVLVSTVYHHLHDATIADVADKLMQSKLVDTFDLSSISVSRHWWDGLDEEVEEVCHCPS